MQESYKNLGQLAPPVNLLVPIYTCTKKAAVISSIVVANNSGAGGSSSNFSVSHAINGASDNIAQYIYVDIPIETQDTFTATIGLSLATGDVIRVYASNGNLSFNLYGTELN